MEELDLGMIPEPVEYASVMALGNECQALLQGLDRDGVLWQWAHETIWLFILTDDAAAHAEAIQHVYDQRTESQQRHTFVIDISDGHCIAVGSCPVLHMKSEGDKPGTVKMFICTIYELIFVHSLICFDWQDLRLFLSGGGSLYIHQPAVADDFSNHDTSFPILNGSSRYICYVCCPELGSIDAERMDSVADLMEKLSDHADVRLTINIIPEKQHPTVTLLCRI